MSYAAVIDQIATPGQVPGLYVRAERRSRVQFDPVRIAPVDDYGQARKAIDRALDRLFSKHDEANVDWYVTCSLGLDVRGAIAWCNNDLTDRVVL